MPDAKLHILAVGAHPDDIEFGCGGVLLGEAARGSEISLCVCSRGEAGSNGTPDEREAEARRAAKILDATIEFLDLGGDSHLEVSAANNIAIARQIRAARPDVLLAPIPSPDQHPDHIVVSQLCRNAARLARYGGLAELRDLAAARDQASFGIRRSHRVPSRLTEAFDHSRRYQRTFRALDRADGMPSNATAHPPLSRIANCARSRSRARSRGRIRPGALRNG